MGKNVSIWWRHHVLFQYRICKVSITVNNTSIFIELHLIHYSDVIMGAMAPHYCYLAIYSGADQRKHQNSASLASLRGNHRWRVNSPHKWPGTRKKFPFNDVIMSLKYFHILAITWIQSPYMLPQNNTHATFESISLPYIKRELRIKTYLWICFPLR